MQKNWKRPSLERLEERANPSMYTFTSSGDTLTITQVSGVSTGTNSLDIADNPGAATITLADAGGTDTVTLSTAGISSINLNLLGSDTVPVNYAVAGAARTGNLTINVANNAARTLNLNTATPVNGNLTLRGGTGALTVNETGSALSVGGNVSMTGGNAIDTLNLAPAGGSSIGGSLTLNKVNVLSFTNDAVGGSIFFNAQSEGTANTTTVTGTTIGGNFNYSGGNSTDAITIDGASVVGGTASVRFSNVTAGTSSLSVAGTATIGGGLTLTGSNLGTDTFNLGATATIAGNITLNLGSGINTVTVSGIVGGTSFSYLGGAGVDTITYTPAAGSSRVRFTASLGAGNDVVNFGTGLTNPSFASIDFGAGADQVTGTLNFPYQFRNLP